MKVRSIFNCNQLQANSGCQKIGNKKSRSEARQRNIHNKAAITTARLFILKIVETKHRLR
eukprot:scaffold214787_cov18-Prasinocladus_malaysianus.AAC.3